MSTTILDEFNKRTDQVVQSIENAIALIEPPPPDVPEELDPEYLQRLTTQPGMGMVKEATNLREFIKGINQGLFTIQVLGKFKNGKSTLLNAILGEKFIPAHTWPTTAVITTIIYGHRSDVAIYRRNIADPDYISTEEFKEQYQLTVDDQMPEDLTVAAQEQLDRFSDIEYAQIESDNPICAARVRLVDSPGLGEHKYRTRTATAFLNSAHAVVYVLNAIAILEQKDTQTIQEDLGEGRLDHVFFVINRINQIDQEDIPGLKDWVRERLRKHFLKHDQSFDEELYNRRVFFVNAKGALDLRQGVDTDDLTPEQITSRLKKTNMPAFEDALHHFLTASDDRLLALYGSAQKLLLKTQRRLQQRISNETAALNRNIDQLLQSEKEVRRDLARLEEWEQDIGRKILEEGNLLAAELYNTFGQFIKEFKRDIERYPFKVHNVDASDLLTAMHDKDREQELQRQIRDAVNDYLEVRFTNWFSGQRKILDDKIHLAQKRIKADVEEFLRDIADTQARFAGTSTVPPDIPEGPFDAAPIADAVAYGRDDWGLTIFQSTTWMARWLSRYSWGPGVYVRVYEKLLPIFQWIDGLIDITVVENERRKHVEKFHKQVIDEMQKALSDDIERPDIFTPGHIRDLATLARRLLTATDPLGTYLRGRLTPEQRKVLEHVHNEGKYGNEEIKAITDFLNTIVTGELIYTPERFASLHLDDEIHYVLGDEYRERRKLELNRWLLTRAYHSAIAEKLRDTINLRLAFEFRQLAERTTAPLRQQLDETRIQVDNIVQRRTAREPSTQQEIARLQWLAGEFNQIMQNIAQLAGER
jgi:tRNA U34 5-carboxymethylaminomethyl modifying GTPase MnmE/TrmE